MSDHLSLSAVGQRAADVMILNRDSTSVRNRGLINQRASDLLKTLARGDSVAARASFGSDARLSSVLEAWKNAQRRFGPVTCIQVLGSDRLDRSAFMTTARVHLGDKVIPVRWAWSGATAVVNSEDGTLPSTLRIGADSPVDAAAWSPYWWPAGRDSALTYDLLTNQTLVMHLSRGESGTVNEIAFDLPPGQRVAGKRVAGEASPMCEPVR